jgi:hypothetical protein
MKAKSKKRQSKDFSTAVGHVLIRAQKAARKIARMYGTPIYFLRNGKVVAEKP